MEMGAETKQRHGCLTAWLVLMIVGGIYGIYANLFNTALLKTAYPNAPAWCFTALALLGVVHIVCAVGLLMWKKWGFYGIAALSVVGVGINVMIGLNIGFALLGLVGVAILYGVLNIGDTDKGWPQLE
jgi:hypothetical protein